MSTRNALQIRAAVLSHYGEVAKRLGLNPPLMLRKVGLTTRMLASPAQLIPLASALSLLEISAKESGCSTFGLHMAEARLLSDFGPISLLLTHQPSMRMALQTIAQYRYLLNESLGMHIEDVGGMVLAHTVFGLQPGLASLRRRLRTGFHDLDPKRDREADRGG